MFLKHERKIVLCALQSGPFIRLTLKLYLRYRALNRKTIGILPVETFNFHSLDLNIMPFEAIFVK